MKQQSLESAASSAAVTQAKVNKLILDFVVSDMQSFNVVEQPSFINLVTGLQPGRTVMTRKALVGKIFCQKSYVSYYIGLDFLLNLLISSPLTIHI